jgi:hypothetical protein
VAETTEQLMAELLRAIPELAPLYAEHVQDNRGEVLPHVLMGDVALFAVAASKDLGRLVSLQALLDFLGEHVNDNDDIRELVMASFLEGLLGEDAAQEAMKPLMPDSLRKAGEAVLGW